MIDEDARDLACAAARVADAQQATDVLVLAVGDVFFYGDELEKAGARIVYREIEDLSHTYPREENARILEWLDPALALPA